jgi:hypothetical protein
MPFLSKLTGPKPRQESSHVVANSAPISGDAGARTLFAKTSGKTIKVEAQTLRGLRLAEGVIHEVKKDCVPANGNQITDLQRSNGWSYLLSQVYRNQAVQELRDADEHSLARAAIKLQAGTCRTNAVCAQVLTQEKCRALAPDDPLRSRPLHLISDSDADHSYLVWGKRAKGNKGKFEDEAIVIDAWTGLPKPYLAKELGKEKKKLDAVRSLAVTENPGSAVQPFDLEREKAAARDPEAIAATKDRIETFLKAREAVGTAPKNVSEVRRHLDSAPEIPTSGPDLLNWAVAEHRDKGYLDDRVAFVDRPNTRYIDKNGNYGTFDHLDPQYVHNFTQEHATARAGQLGQLLAKEEAEKKARQQV